MAKKITLSEKNPKELSDMLVELRDSHRAHRFASAGARPKDTSARRNTRKQIARVLTELGTQKRNAQTA